MCPLSTLFCFEIGLFVILFITWSVPSGMLRPCPLSKGVRHRSLLIPASIFQFFKKSWKPGSLLQNVSGFLKFGPQQELCVNQICIWGFSFAGCQSDTFERGSVQALQGHPLPRTEGPVSVSLGPLAVPSPRSPAPDRDQPPW